MHVKVFSSHAHVTSGWFDLENAFLNGQQRDIKGSSFKVENEDVLHTNELVLLIKTARKSHSRRLVDNPENADTSDYTSVLRRLTLTVTEKAGTVTVASSAVVPRYAFAASLILTNTIDEISSRI